MVAPSLRSLGAVLASSTATPSFAAPAGAVSTDVIIVAFNTDDGRTTITGVPSNFTAASGSPQINDPSLGSPSHRLDVYWGRFSDVGAGPYSFTTSSVSFIEGRTAAIKDCITTGNPFEATSGATSGNTNVTTAPSVSATSTDVDRYAFYIATNWTGGAWTPATGFTEQWDANDQIITFDDKTLSTAQTVTPQAVCAVSSRENAWVGILLPVPSASIPPPSPRTVPARDVGEVWWLQRDRRDANTVATAADPVPSPLDSAWQAGARHWHLYNDAAAIRSWRASQRTYVSDPNLLTVVDVLPAPVRTVQTRDAGEAWWQQPARRDPNLLTAAQLENELLGGASTSARAMSPATNAPRWWMPQQPKRDATTPGLLDAAELEGPLLAGDIHRHVNAAAYTDRREVPQQRTYLSDPSFYPTVAPTDPLTLAYGAGGTYWLLYNRAAVIVDRREVPQQRLYVSDPLLLTAALLENELLGGADTGRHLAWFTDRRTVPQQRPYNSNPNLLTAADIPAADNRRVWFADRRTQPQQRRNTDPAILASALLEGVLLGSGDTARHAAWFTDRRQVPQQPPRWPIPVVLVPADPLLVAGADTWRRTLLAATHADRRRAGFQPPRWPVVEETVCRVHRPNTGTVTYAYGGTITRPYTGIVEFCTCCT